VTSPELPAKKDVARALLLRGSVFIHLDPRKAGVVVPSRLRAQAQVVLQVGLDMPVPIPDLRVDEEGVFGTLSFKGVPFACSVPWDAVFALVGDDGKGMIWSSEMPHEVAGELEREARPAGSPASLVYLDSFRTGDRRPSSQPPRKKSERVPAPGAHVSSRPAYLRVVK
jgi:stringent starvation protein B